MKLQKPDSLLDCWSTKDAHAHATMRDASASSHLSRDHEHPLHVSMSRRLFAVALQSWGVMTAAMML